MPKYRLTKFGEDKRRKHRHWRVTVYYGDRKTFVRVYTDLKRARRFAERQRKSPVVKRTQIKRIV